MPTCCCLFASPLFSITGVALGIVSLNKIKENPMQYKGHEMAIAGIVLSSVGVLFEILAFLTTWDDAIRSRFGYQL